MIHWYDRAGQPIDRGRASTLLEDRDYATVARDQLEDHVVSTIWLATDFNVTGDVPHLFETQIWGPFGLAWQERYPTEAAARAGHERAITFARIGLVMWGVGAAGRHEHAFLAVRTDHTTPPTALCGDATTLTWPPAERGDLPACHNCQAECDKRTEGAQA